MEKPRSQNVDNLVNKPKSIWIKEPSKSVKLSDTFWKTFLEHCHEKDIQITMDELKYFHRIQFPSYYVGKHVRPSDTKSGGIKQSQGIDERRVSNERMYGDIPNFIKYY